MNPPFDGVDHWWSDPGGKLLLTTLQCALNDDASYIILDGSSEPFHIRFQVGGELHDVCEPPPQVVPALLRYAELMGQGCDGTTPQRARARLDQDTRVYNWRLCYWPDKVVITRIDGRIAPPRLGQLGMTEEQLGLWEGWLQKTGLLLVSGPGNSGRSDTLLASALKLGYEEKRVVTLEDPEERWAPGLRQVDLRKQGGTFLDGIDSVKHSGKFEVVMISELDDPEVAREALQLAQDGYLVLGAVEAENTTEALWKLAPPDLGMELRKCVLGVASQRLTSLLCERCREAVVPPASFGVPQVYRAVGCSSCYRGYRRRTARFEILEPPPHWWELESAAELREVARMAGMKTLRERWLESAAAGEIPLENCPE